MIMKLLLVFCLFAFTVFSLPYHHKITLANSLIVGRDDMQDLFDWECKVCSAENKPIHSHSIEEKAKDVKCIVSVYDDFIVLAFRYTNTAQNVWQDILYPLQVFLFLFRLKTQIHVQAAKFRKHTKICGFKLLMMWKLI